MTSGGLENLEIFEEGEESYVRRVGSAYIDERGYPLKKCLIKFKN